MKKFMVFTKLIFISLLFVACGGNYELSDISPNSSISTGDDVLSNSREGRVDEAFWPEGQSQEDTQGSVSIKVTSQNLNNVSDTIDFDVALNTHSVDLSMDLATLSTLTTDTGLTVNALLWDAPRGGHHINGTLSFAATMDGFLVLENASQITLTIHDIDAPERIYSWHR